MRKYLLKDVKHRGLRPLKERCAAACGIAIFVAFFILLHASFSQAGQPASCWRTLDKTKVIKVAKTVTRAKYPNADVVDVDEHRWVKYDENGTYIEWYESYSKILTEKGKRSLKTISSSFTIPYNTTRFTLVEVIKSNGTATAVDINKNSRIMVEPAQMRSNIYNPNNKILQVSIPELKVGDLVHFIIFDDYARVRVPGTWSDYAVFEGINPIIRSEYTVVAPKKKPLQRIALKAEIPGTVTHTEEKEGDFIVYKWIAKNVPRAFPEPMMPPLHTQVQRLLVSTVKDWRQISRWYWNLSKPNIDRTSPEMKKTVQQLIRGIDDPHEKIRRLFQWVSQEIRYLGLTVEKVSPGYEPHPAIMTFDRRAGVCRDKAALLVSMLRLAGFDAYPALIMVGPKKDPEVPQPFFNHAITCIRQQDGSYLLMDPTDENTRQLFPPYLNNQSYLVATPEGETLRTTPVQPPEENMMFIETTGELDAKGNLKAKTVLRFGGINDNVYRGYFARLSADERRGYFEKIIKEIIPGARLDSYEIRPSNILDTDKQLEARLSFQVKDILIAGKNTVMLPVLRLGNRVGMAHRLTREMGLRKRKYPYFTRCACGVKEITRLTLNGSVGRIVSLPESEIVEKRGTAWRRDLSFNGETLVCESLFKIKLPEYSPQDYLSFRETMEKIESSNRKMAIFSAPAAKKTSTAAEWYSAFHADAVILDEIDEYDLEDARNWTETKQVKIKVLTYAGKKENSNIYIDYNPIWEDVEIKKGLVTSPSGQIKRVEDKEINEMDACWVGDAPRYPAAKILVVSLPGVEEGSTIEYTIVRKKKNRPFFSMNGAFCYHDMMQQNCRKTPDHYFFSVDGMFRYHYPVVRKTVRLKIPDHLPLKILKADQGIGLNSLWKRKPQPVICERSRRCGNKTIYEFTATNVEPVKREDHMPPWYSFNPVVFASAGNWSAYANEVRQQLLKAASSQPETAAKGKDLVKGICGDRKRIIAIRDFVAENIRPVGVAISDIPLDHISPSDQTLADGYGNSADRAVLLYALLRAAGYSPEFVLSSWASPVKSLQRPLRECPDPAWFHDLLVRVNTDEGYIYLNDTDQYAALGSTPSDGHPGLLLQSGQIITISALAPELKEREDQTFSLKLLENGDVTIKKKRRIYGMDFARFHKQIDEMSPEERRRHHQKLVNSISRSARATDTYITNYNVYPAVEEFSVRVDNFAARQGDFLYLKLPGLITGIEGVERDKRNYPMYRDRYSRLHITIKVTLPEGIDSFQVTPPEFLSFPVERSGKITLKTSPAPSSAVRCLTIQQDVNLKPVVVLPDEYPKLLRANHVLGQAKTRMLLLKLKRRTRES